MHIPEPLETINKRLLDFFGRFENGEPNWRVVWSSDLYEKQLTDIGENGIILPYKILRELPKYSYAKDRYILERLLPVPAQNSEELTTKLSYEPVWVFEDNQGNALPPVWDVIKILIDTIIDQMTRPFKPVYKQAEEDGNTIEALEYKARKLEEAIYGNETSVTDALAVGDAVGYGTYRRNDSRFNNKVKVH